MNDRKARCFHYNQKTGKALYLRAGNECNYGQSDDEICTCEQPSSKQGLPFFEKQLDKDFDMFYCGCRGWD